MPLYRLPLLLLLLRVAVAAVVAASSGTRFDFGTLTLSSLRLLGDAHLRNGTIQLSRDLPVPGSGAGRALYAHPVRFRHPVTGTPFSFSTFFSFSVTNLNPSSVGGGLAFLLCSDGRSVGDAGGFLGLVNASAPPGDASVVVAVEFDTLMDVEFSDINGNHVGLDLNSLVSTQSTDLAAQGVELRSGDLVNAWVDYDGGQQLLQVWVSYSTLRPGAAALALPLDLSRFVDDFMYVGFSASTQGSTEMHSVEWWSFASGGSPTPVAAPSSSPPPPQMPPAPLGPTMSVSVAASPSNATDSPPPRRRAVAAGAATAGAVVVAALAGVLLWGFSRRRRRRNGETLGVEVVAVARSPREFGYRELSAATRGFDASRIIGHGAFGTVYRGDLPTTGAAIAVKRCTKGGGGSGGSGQGKAEFLSELSIIAGLRHRNLVRLQGWCHEKGEILLVYDYMPHGSLDRALFDPSAPPLTWRQRRRILSGVASALAYLHCECERQVIHRDVKSSNVMLDEGFHARLGDFGLARQVDHGQSPDATVTAGTMGYLAPEYLLTGRATDKTDVFSFGALVLEVACGRRPIEERERDGGFGSGRGRNLVEWVWGLYGEGREVEAVDARVRGECEEGEAHRVMAVGLSCSHPDAGARPGMRAVVQMLGGEADPPNVPRARPTASLTTSTQYLLMSLQDSASDVDGALSGEPYSSSSSVCGGEVEREDPDLHRPPYNGNRDN